MTRKKPSAKAAELEQNLKQAELVEGQMEKQALLKATETDELSRYTEERDLMNQLIGQVQMSRSIAKFVDVVSLTKAAHIKKNRLYQSVKGRSAIDHEGKEIADVGTWDGFCRLIGTTRSKMDEDIRNLELFGEDALNSLNRIGAGYRELRKLRKLPEDERDLIINGEAVKVSDKESLIELIDEMASKHSRNKETLEKRAKDLEGDLEASRRVVEEKSKRITDLETEMQKKAAMGPDERAKELSERLERETFLARSAYLGPRSVIKEILEWEDAPRDLTHGCAQAIARLRIALDELQSDFMLEPVTLDFDDSLVSETE